MGVLEMGEDVGSLGAGFRGSCEASNVGSVNQIQVVWKSSKSC